MNDQVSPAVAGFDNVKIHATKDVAWIRIDFDDDGHPMYMGERLVELRPGYWVHPWNWELQLQELEGMERANREHVPDSDPIPVPAPDPAAAKTQDVRP